MSRRARHDWILSSVRCGRRWATKRRSTSGSFPFHRRLRIEPLEDRLLLALVTVDTLADTVDFNDGVTSLREAIFATNLVDGADTIEFAAALTSGGPATITLTQGELAITDSLTINGPGANLLTIDANGNDPTPDTNNGDGSHVFNIDDRTSTRRTVSVSGLTLTGGDSSGGAISTEEHLTVTSSTISGNSASFHGGGISINHANLTVINSTLNGNSTSGYGGGVLNFIGQAVIRFSTITNNEASDGQGSGLASYGHTSTRTEVHSSIIAGNVNSDVAFVDGATNSFQSNGYNLIGTGNATGEFIEPGDQTGVADPLLGPLAHNGGPTMTHALLTGSPAIDAGDPAAVAGVGDVPLYDERAAPFARVAGGRIDMGAFELQTLGDMDFDGDLDFDDVDDFVLGLIDAGAYEALHGVPPSTNGDMVRNGVFDFDDVSGFADRLGSDPVAAAAGTASLSTHESFTVEPIVPRPSHAASKKWKDSRDGLDGEASVKSLGAIGEQLGRHLAGFPRWRFRLVCANLAPCFREATRATPRPLEANQLDALWSGDLGWLSRRRCDRFGWAGAT